MMGPEDLREQLSATAELAGTPNIDTDRVAGRVRRRRTARFTVQGGAVLALAAAGTFGVLQWNGGPSRAVDAAGSGSGSGAGTGAVSASPSTGTSGAPAPGPYVCGQRPDLSGAASTRDGLTLELGSVRRTSDQAGPEIAVSLRSETRRTVVSTPPASIEVLYLKDGVIRGGGPMLNPPGDLSPQGVDMAGHPVDLEPGRPDVQRLGERNALCPSSSWSEVWSDPAGYEVVVVLRQPVETPAAQPAPDPAPLLVVRAPLSR
ncbi:hypothetical protein MTF65_09440 [Streptomyces sp. APSN-46.1]|uniref:hypothetical protein n=1 Tax=Streptomyces sp. APSN-46.1 TaxID=2929049 RepID=UPI001FB4A6F9|nr:hypothetical protein [Streptomyces sp. APSN-46.1]MCJ1677554.1 hypothetical protein [Streptomyces sp. APSN-46.1]